MTSRAHITVGADESCVLTIGDDTSVSWSSDEYIPYVPVDIPTYDGETTVTPRAHSQTVLGTTNKLVLSDITVLKVPYYETSNASGMTAYIASEV